MKFIVFLIISTIVYWIFKPLPPTKKIRHVSVKSKKKYPAKTKKALQQLKAVSRKLANR